MANEERKSHQPNDQESRTSTLDGITIDLNDELANASVSIRINDDGDANDTEESN
jgi:hypothetical protein